MYLITYRKMWLLENKPIHLREYFLPKNAVVLTLIYTEGSIGDLMLVSDRDKH